MKSKNKISKKIKSQEILSQKIDNLNTALNTHRELVFRAINNIPTIPQESIQLAFVLGMLFGGVIGFVAGVLG